MKTFEVKKVNHGNVFGTGNWFMFHCGNCNTTFTSKCEECENCKSKTKWN